jgi:hypothetical protein
MTIENALNCLWAEVARYNPDSRVREAWQTLESFVLAQQTHNSENTPCHHRFKSTPSGTMVECVDCGVKFTYNKGW